MLPVNSNINKQFGPLVKLFFTMSLLKTDFALISRFTWWL